jgi:protoheme IX farnesyltransferase
LVPVAFGIFGLVYAVPATLLGVTFAWAAFRLWRETTKARAVALFHYSLLYLALLFVAMAADAVA